ncbi:MAG: AAA family ATPase [Proteobacteria bacterium]|nr:AAA family ATPase [Pseudomonadota bacterium]
MGFRIAVSGKGGTGKTIISGLILGYLLRKGKGPILAVDADANANLNEVLGVKYEQTIGGVREKLRTDVPPGITKNIWFEMKAEEALVETEHYDLLVMGLPEGQGCYCVANALASKCIDVLTQNYNYVIIDNEAGMEHFSRLTTHDIDLLFVISDSSIRGLQAARRILDLIKKLNLSISRSEVLLSQVKDGINPSLKKEADRLEIEIAGFVPFDENIFQSDLEGKPTYNLPESSPSVRELGKILDKTL